MLDIECMDRICSSLLPASPAVGGGGARELPQPMVTQAEGRDASSSGAGVGSGRCDVLDTWIGTDILSFTKHANV